MLNFQTTTMTVVARAVYNALGAGAVALLTTYSVTDSWNEAAIVAGITALGALGFRGAGEGIPDIMRDSKGKVLPGDVGQP